MVKFYSLLLWFLGMIMNGNDLKRKESVNYTQFKVGIRLNHNIILHVQCYFQGLEGYKIKWMQCLPTP